ncbi:MULTISPECIES: 5-oxoprolinase subunit B family protein [Agrobacterium]|uniref:Carboxyltransferase domain-containing protein n=1 Tax=Agrobacterium rubi TaxID=28099 RepID=A0AAE7RFV7_9HYPH|nr:MULTISPECIES: carboxyltransferase domain-containing protein [Agrobacterium]MBN7808934.1 carboxyltransferase domain-containing protein [Agrobacterium rosae]NTE89864.1 carboxyltransferase domain-containing protein [Agrobacterium rubi]NTF05286.1 carboxyltransferase domain-containing protein [Agrobacterium rubi]NTF10540.1 carboxyltransferase domain-containing protein [Agrobacterium rubi]NTF22934.1 carboxyltransferase domain-containing protein [Agrobacterium rubi]
MARYTFGGDEHLLVEIDAEMSLQAFSRALGICNGIRESGIRGVTEICPANASLLLRFDPDIIEPETLLREVKQIEASLGAEMAPLSTRVIELPVYFDDPWTRETLMRFRDRHQDPNSTDLEYSARVNGYPGVDKYIEAFTSAPWFVSMVGFVAGDPFLFQMVERARQLEVPKYVRPRTDTPRLCVAHGGCFSGIYPVRGAGGYQMYGITPLPIYDPSQSTPYLRDFMILFQPGDIVKYRAIGREEYDDIVDEIDTGRFVLNEKPVSFSLKEFKAAPTAYGNSIVEALYA